MARTTNLQELTTKLHDDQVERFVKSGKPLDEFLDDSHEALITETLHVLLRLRLIHPEMTFEW